MNTHGKLYDQFKPAERLSLLLEALARGDRGEADRLGRSCPRRTYTQSDAAFGERMDLAFDTMAVVCIDLRGLWGKLDLLEWSTGMARVMATHHQITVSMAFLDGDAHGKELPQLEFFSKERMKPTIKDASAEVPEDAIDDVDTVEEPASTPLPSVTERSRRMMAVEDRMEGMTNTVFLTFFQAAHDLAGQLATTWAAFGRFCRERVGVAPDTMLEAWGFPIAQDFVTTLKRHGDPTPDPAIVDDYFKMICANWDERFGGGE